MENKGYHKLSRFMVDEQYAIFRQFKLLANRDLLYLQAELAHLEAEFSELAERDRSTEGEQELYDANWYLLSSSKGREQDGQQWEKALLIRTKLREYCLTPKSKFMKSTLLISHQTTVYHDTLRSSINLKRGSEMLQCLKIGFRGQTLGAGYPSRGMISVRSKKMCTTTHL